MKLNKLKEIREQLIEDKENLGEGKTILLEELNYLYEEGILPRE